MKIEEIKKILNAKLICGEKFLDNTVFTACGSDMMSDVLAYVHDQAALLSGLVNPQVVRTAEMMDIKCIIFVRGKHPDDDIINLAIERDIVLLATDLEMFTACGLLYKNGLKGGSGI